MSLRWRKDKILCGAKSEALEGDTYIDDRLHYKLAVELKVIEAMPDESETGEWRWVSKVPCITTVMIEAKMKERERCVKVVSEIQLTTEQAFFRDKAIEAIKTYE